MKLYLWFFRKLVNLAIKLGAKLTRKMTNAAKEKKKVYQKWIDKAYIIETYGSDRVMYAISRIYGEQEFGATKLFFERQINEINKEKDLFRKYSMIIGLASDTEPLPFKLMLKMLCET